MRNIQYAEQCCKVYYFNRKKSISKRGTWHYNQVLREFTSGVDKAKRKAEYSFNSKTFIFLMQA